MRQRLVAFARTQDRVGVHRGVLATGTTDSCAFRRNPAWRDSWIPSPLTVPAVFAANAVFSAVGDGAATRSGTVVIFAWIAFVSVRLLQKGEIAARAAPCR